MLNATLAKPTTEDLKDSSRYVVVLDLKHDGVAEFVAKRIGNSSLPMKMAFFVAFACFGLAIYGAFTTRGDWLDVVVQFVGGLFVGTMASPVFALGIQVILFRLMGCRKYKIKWNAAKGVASFQTPGTTWTAGQVFFVQLLTFALPVGAWFVTGCLLPAFRTATAMMAFAHLSTCIAEIGASVRRCGGLRRGRDRFEV